MKIRNVFSLLIVLFAFLTLNMATSFAQELPKQINILVGHTGYVNSVVFSPDGKTIASGDGYPGNTVRLWDAATGTLLNTMEHYSVNSVAFSPDGKTIASASDSGRIDPPVRLWDARTGTLLNELTGARLGIKSVTFSPDGKTIAGTGVETCFWDVQTGTRLDLAPRGGGNAIAYSPDGKIIAIGGYGAVYFWDAQTREHITELEHFSEVRSIAYSPDGNRIASVEGTEVFLWDIQTRTLQNTLQHFAWTSSVAYSPDGNMVASVRGTQVWLWDAHTGTLLHKLVGHPDGARYVTYSPDGNTLAVGCSDQTVRLWQLMPGVGTTGVTHTATDTSSTTASITLTNTVQDSLQLQNTLSGHTGSVNSITFSPDGKTLASAGNEIYLWDVVTGTLKTKFTERTAGTLGIAFSPDGKTMVSVSASYLVLWDVATGTLTRDLTDNRGGGLSVAYSPDGKRIAVGSYGAVNLWDTATGLKAELVGHTDEVYGVAYSPDGNTLASGCKDRTVRLWDAITGRLKNTIEHTSQIWSVSYSPDGSTIASTSFDNTVRLWNAATGQLLNTLSEHTDWFPSVAYSPDGHTLASGSWDNTVHLWDAATGRHLNTFSEHTGPVNSVAFSPDGTILASGSSDGTVLLWSLTPSAVSPNISDARVKADVNNDGVVNIQDLVSVAANFGFRGQHPADVNGDGTVDIRDLVAVAAAFGGMAANAPAAVHLSQFSPETVQQWLTQAQHLSLTDATSQRSIRFLEQLLLTLTPKETALLANYPNPFNPETWIPYQLATPADVTLHIHAADGSLVQTLVLGHKAIGVYQSRSRAAYWDGKNEIDEPVASGVYFYTLTAGDFTATRKMLIRK